MMWNGDLQRRLRELTGWRQTMESVNQILRPSTMAPDITAIQRQWTQGWHRDLQASMGLSLVDAISSMQRRNDQLMLEAVSGQGLAFYFQWLNAPQAEFLSLRAATMPSHVADQLKLDYFQLDWVGSALLELSEQWGANSSLSHQANLLLSAHREFASWLASEPIAGPVQRGVSPLYAAGSNFSVRLLTSAVGVLDGAEPQEASEPSTESTPPTVYDALSTEIKDQQPILITLPRDEVEQWFAQALVVRITDEAKRVMLAWNDANEAMELNGEQALFVLTNEVVRCAVDLLSHVASDRDGFDRLMDRLYKLLVDAANPKKGSQEVRRLRLMISKAPAIVQLQLLRNRYSHSAATADSAERAARLVSAVFKEYCGVRSPHTSQHWQQVQLALLAHLAECLEELPKAINQGRES